MKPEEWGPPVWIFLHTLAEKIKEDKFNELFPFLFNHIRRICSVLPCPECSNHANNFLSKVLVQNIKTKSDFKNVMYSFHNLVNYRKKKEVYKIEDLSIYEKNNIIDKYNHFISVYHTKGNMKLLTESFQRKIILSDFRKWLLINIKSFL
jgi:hypothetical protein